MPRVIRRTSWALVVLAALVLVPTAAADYEDEQALAERFAPIVRVVEQTEECGHGEPFVPTDIDRILGQDTVALRGPWSPTDLVKIGPVADDLVGRFEYHLDFPGNALDAGCSYEHWANHIGASEEPVVYAHVVTEAGRPGVVALQYWFFYPFNDFNNTHEGDWEMVQLNFEAGDAASALGTTPAEVGYSAHEGATSSEWKDDTLEVVDSRPVVYPAAGSHANKYSAALWLGSSAEAGVGCDDTRGPHRELSPRVETIPSDPAAARAAYPWIAFEGRWGELQPAFFNGPTGPNLKQQWTEPIDWSHGWRSRSYAVPTAGVLGTGATDFFCDAVAAGSRGLIRLLRNPGPTLALLAALLAIAVFLATRTTYRPSAPLRIGRRRSWGQILTAAGRMYFKQARLFLTIGLLFIPLGLVISLVQALVLGGFGLLGVDTTGEAAGALALIVVALGTTLALLGFGLVQAATACALVEVDSGRPIGAIQAYRVALARLRPLVRGLALAVLICLALVATWFLIPVAIWLAVRWSLLAQAVELESGPGRRALRRSAELVRGHWFRVASLVGISALLALAAGPLVGALLIFATDAPLALLNFVAGIVYAVAMPFVAITTSYVYFDARARAELERREDPAELPAEIELA